MVNYSKPSLTRSLVGRFHSIVQFSPKWWIPYCLFGVLGLLVSAVIVGYFYVNDKNKFSDSGTNKERQLVQIKETIASLEKRKHDTQIKLQEIDASKADRLRDKSVVLGGEPSSNGGLSIGGYSEEEIDYWRKQMDLFSMLNGTNMTITGRGTSSFRNAMQLTVKIVATPGVDETKVKRAILRALDFLSLYGYVDSFNGTEALVHIQRIN